MIHSSILLIVILGLIVSALKSVVKIEENEQAVIERLGKFNRLIGPGLHFIFPFVESPKGIEENNGCCKFFRSEKISLLPQSIEFPKDDRCFFTQNNEQLKVKGELVYQITDPYKAVYEVAYPLDAINQLTASIIQKRLIEKGKDSDSVVQLKEISDGILEISNGYAINWGIKILNLTIKQITASNGIRHNFEE